MNRIVLIALLLAASMSFQSCSLWRKVFHRKDKKSTALVIGGTDNSAGKKDTSGKNYYGTDTMKTTASLSSMMPLWDRDIAYHTFSGKAKVHYDGKGDQQDFTAFIRMERGKKVWISIVALGLVEALRAQVTPDSVIAIDRIHHTVRALPASEAGKLLPAGFDFASLQRLLIGDVLHGAKKPDAVTTLSDGGWQFTLNDGDVYQNAVFSARDSTLSSPAFTKRGRMLLLPAFAMRTTA